MRKVLLILLLISLPGCQPGKESPARSTALREVKRLIDQDSFPAKYIIMYEEPSNDIGSIYKITPANSPFVEWSLERPEKVIKYKDRYICLMNPMESIDMPKEKLIERCQESDLFDACFAVRKEKVKPEELATVRAAKALEECVVCALEISRRESRRRQS